MGYAKKALDLAIQADKVKEFVSHLKNFIEVTKTDLFSTQDKPSKKAQHIVQSTDWSNEDES
ncbi:7696_t:CDS:2 [Gigaspora rosea]|nr:7696_t:CDS:2 [Gigaspora rosea]